MTSLKYLTVYKIDGPALNDVKGETLCNESRKSDSATPICKKHVI